MTALPPQTRIGALALHAVTEADCVALICEQLERGAGGWVLTANLDHLRLCAGDPVYAALCASATLRVADGMPLVWASRLQGAPLPERVAGSNLVSSIAAAAAEHGRSLFLCGGTPGTADAAAAILRERHPHLRIAGTLCPLVGFANHAGSIERLVEQLQRVAPDIVYVALSKPLQERVISALRPRLPSAWFIGVGIGFSFLTGHVPRAPRWMQRSGLEWLHRLSHQPHLAQRYLIDGIPFAMGFLIRAATRRYRPERRG